MLWALELGGQFPLVLSEKWRTGQEFSMSRSKYLRVIPVEASQLAVWTLQCGHITSFYFTATHIYKYIKFFCTCRKWMPQNTVMDYLSLSSFAHPHCNCLIYILRLKILICARKPHCLPQCCHTCVGCFLSSVHGWHGFSIRTA